MKRFAFLCSLFCAVVLMRAQAPAGYYNGAKGKSGAALKTALFGIVKDHVQRSYRQLWTDFKTTDVRKDGKIWDMYSGVTNYVPGGSAQGASYSREGDSYNREHSFPKSWFSDGYPMYTDLFHLYPTDGYVNNRRSNYPFGENKGETYTSQNGFSKLGSCTTPGYSGTVFEPNDEYKGDFARAYFYMATAYEDRISGWKSPMLSGNSYPAYANWALTMLLRWAEQDPVSEKEIKRNEAVYGIQKNRNPYIDYPGLEQYVWGSKSSTAFDPDNYDKPSGGGGTTPDPNPEVPTVVVPQFAPAAGEVAVGTVVSISSDVQGATICYKINQGVEEQGASPVKVTINETTTIQAYTMLNGTRSETVKVTYTIKEEVLQGAQLYKMVTSENELQSGVDVLVACTEKGKVMASQGKDIRSYVDMTPNADNTLVTEVNAEGKPYAFTLGGQPGGWTFFDQVKQVYVALTADANKLHTATSAIGKEAQWTICISATGEALVSSVKYPKRAIKYNSGAPRFATYRSGQSPIAIFKESSTSGIAQYIGAQVSDYRVYEISGRLVRTARTIKEALHQLPRGMYIVNGKKILVR